MTTDSNSTEAEQTASADCVSRLVRQSFPDYGVEVEATTIDGETGVWSHGQYGWCPKGMWGRSEYPHDHITLWKSLPNAKSAGDPPTND